MSAVIDALWAQIEPTVFIQREQFERELDGWEIEPVEIDGKLAIVALTKGPEFHFATFGTGAPVRLWKWLNPIIDRHGFATTRTPKDAARQHRFNLKFGFTVTGEDEFFMYYRLERSCH